jgi:hypothetical protein
MRPAILLIRLPCILALQLDHILIWLQLDAKIHVHVLNSHKDMIEFICYFTRAVAKLPLASDNDGSDSQLNIPINLVGSTSVRGWKWGAGTRTRLFHRTDYTVDTAAVSFLSHPPSSSICPLAAV